MSFLQIHPKIRIIDTMMYDHCGGEVASLNPQNKVCTSFEELLETLPNTHTFQLSTFIDSLSIIVKEELLHFPNNIFWDKNYFLSYFVYQITQIPVTEQESYISKYVQMYVSLLELFGNTSTIRFQYLHDFTYGFDWAKWVRNDSKNRNTILPFSMTFLQRMYHRGKELEQLIQKNDELYPSITRSEFRNPFQFQRSIECEFLLFKQLASKECIPIIAWEQNGSVDWKKNYSELREIEAKNQGLTK